MFHNPFELWLVREEAIDGLEPEEYMQLTYSGQNGIFSGEFSRSEMEDLKDAIRNWESQFYDQ